MYNLDLEKAEESSTGSEKSKRIPEKKTYFCFIDYAKVFVWITTNCGKFLMRWEYQITLPASWDTV